MKFKFDIPKLQAIFKESFKKLNLPENPQDVKPEQVADIVFMSTVMQAILMANTNDVSFERRRELIEELVRIDECITAEARLVAQSVAETVSKSYLN